LPKHSVILRTWNRAAYLPRAINSILAQTEQDWELIVVSDGCTDSTPKLMEYYCKKDPRIKYYQKEHTGIADTGNFAIERATGDYISQADSDDIQLPTKLEIVAEGLADGADFTYSGYYHCNPKGEPWEYCPPRELTPESIKANNAICGTTISYPKKTWEKTPYRKELAINDDLGFAIDLYKAGYTYKMVDKPSFKYCLMRTSTSYQKKKLVDKSTERMAKEIDELA